MTLILVLGMVIYKHEGLRKSLLMEFRWGLQTKMESL